MASKWDDFINMEIGVSEKGELDQLVFLAAIGKYYLDEQIHTKTGYKNAIRERKQVNSIRVAAEQLKQVRARIKRDYKEDGFEDVYDVLTQFITVQRQNAQVRQRNPENIRNLIRRAKNINEAPPFLTYSGISNFIQFIERYECYKIPCEYIERIGFFGPYGDWESDLEDSAEHTDTDLDDYDPDSDPMTLFPPPEITIPTAQKKIDQPLKPGRSNKKHRDKA
ncbi:hypothetical protein [Magnetofaba australis]|uniref:Uncharacterized protein n=1 Tax=Magnetofaba australis IT-1 TaxID=1434232 RepID=A0A1Y2K4T2_9PROT|nr:hypothetical protein [Magnetofaba australis]OSM04335.1 hypothetical protein MAIT1_04225 [Magnetofaba australis IT-1]